MTIYVLQWKEKVNEGESPLPKVYATSSYQDARETYGKLNKFKGANVLLEGMDKAISKHQPNNQKEVIEMMNKIWVS